MVIRRVCKICGNPFFAIKTNQFFCSRKCFKKDYYIKTKIRLQNGIQNPKFPEKHCDFCDAKSKLNFDPTKDPGMFSGWRCPICGVSNKMIWKYHEHPNSREEISKMLIIIDSNSPNTAEEHKYQVYHIPIIRPEQCQSTILTMACEVINIMSVRKMNRKKIIFS